MNFIKCKIENKDVVLNRVELKNWFVENSAADGTVQKTIILYDTVNNIKKGEFVMSDFNLNRLGMKIDPSGWELENYQANPVLLWNHDSDIPAIGNMNNVRIDGNKLVGRPVFVDKEIDEFAWSIGQKVDNGILTSGSVGFITLKVEVEEKEDKLPVVISKEQELYEFSIVNIPALVSAVKHSVKPPETRDDDYMVNDDDYMQKLFVDHEKEPQETTGISFLKEKENTLSIFKKNEEK